MYSRFLFKNVGSCLRNSVLRVTMPNRNLYFTSVVAAARSAPNIIRFNSTEVANDFDVDELQDDAPGKLVLNNSLSVS